MDLDRSTAFYAHLGFEVDNTYTPDQQAKPTWAWLTSNGSSLMIARADHPIDPEAQGAIYYFYCDDVPAMHGHLQRLGLAPGKISYPFYCPKGEFRLVDPDGYGLMTTHT
jgi:hypothetical protein